MKLKFVYLLALSAFILSGTAAYFSVIGMASLFSGAFYSVVVMIGGLELAKLVTASFLYRYWSDITKVFKIYLTIGVITVMIITSAGIFGFLSSAYSITADKLSQVEGQIELLERKKEIINSEVDRTKEIIDSKSKRINSLTSLRAQQEVRIDTLYSRRMITSVRKTEQIIRDANTEIGKLNREVDSLSNKMQIVMNGLNTFDIDILELKNSDVKGEIGPLKYISILTGKSIESVVNFFIFLLIFVFDPLAICLVIATNKVLLKEKKVDKVPIMKEPKPGKNLELIDLILNKYCKVCEQASKDDKVFNTFKTHPDVVAVLEHASKDLGQRYLDLIEEENSYLLDIKSVWDNDKYGSPKLEKYKRKNGEEIMCSPTTLQYIGVVSNLIDSFGGLKDWIIVEIGGGYGGQCKIIQDIFKIQSYDIFDLKEVILLQEKYLKKLDCFVGVDLFTDKEIGLAAINYDLVISNYALSELTQEEQLEYVKRICLNSKHGYLTCNSPLNGINLLEDKFNTFDILRDIKGERETNYIVTW